MGRRAAPTVLWLGAAVVAALTAYAALRRPADVRLSDLSVYLGAVAGLTDGASLYDFIRGNAPFTYPPFAALLFTPLTWLPTLPLQLAWSLATVATVLGLARLVARAHEPRTLAEAGDRRPTVAAALALMLMLSAPVSSDLKYGQVSLFLAGLITLDLLALRRTPWHGALIGFTAAVKLTPLIFIPLLWYAGRRTAALTATATFAGCAAVAALALPGDSWRFWTTEMFQVSRLGYITSAGNQSLNGALMRFELPVSLRSALVLLIGGTVAAVALRRGARLARSGDWLSATVVAGAASVVLSPVSWTHHQIWLVLAALLPVRGPAWVARMWTATVVAVMVLPVTALGTPLWTNARLVLAITIAAAVPFVRSTRTNPDRSGQVRGDGARGDGVRRATTAAPPGVPSPVSAARRPAPRAAE
ncbi:glycosyltransferase 87 family protein [Jidongwangia harbinensis]|uniref:glycosyltransferase 87 family protein n=1 Tax=Jidongwangia harbinensis TaxID=2878561 RepID=UPI001CD98557|nr:glycosyltransferase 87 family protein [Jidongwangia harbinensis]MCA2216795.1 glycosyltransferase 87 family protein [Jidongwangia harbinensis]